MFMKAGTHHSRRLRIAKNGVGIGKTTRTRPKRSGSEGAVVRPVLAHMSIDLLPSIADRVAEAIETLARDGDRIALIPCLPHPLPSLASHRHELDLDAHPCTSCPGLRPGWGGHGCNRGATQKMVDFERVGRSARARSVSVCVVSSIAGWFRLLRGPPEEHQREGEEWNDAGGDPHQHPAQPLIAERIESPRDPTRGV